MTKKKIVNVDTEENRELARNSKEPAEQWKADDASKAKARNFRVFAFLSWLVAIGIEIGAIVYLNNPPVNTMILIGMIVVIAVLAVVGAELWKKANRLDPASKKNKVKFFIQNQLGLIMSVLAFLPLIILILMNKDMDKQQKGIVGGVAVVALLIAGYFGIDFNPPSIEEYTEQTQEVVSLTGQDYVYWTRSGTRYHLYEDCYHINKDVTTEIYQGTVAEARALKNITELCKTCKDRWIEEHPEGVADHDDHDHIELAAVRNLLP